VSVSTIGESEDLFSAGLIGCGKSAERRAQLSAVPYWVLSHDIIWRILVSVGSLPALAVYGARRHLKETPRFLKAAGHEEDDSGKLKKAGHYDKKTHSVSFWDGFHRLVDNKMILSRLVGASAAWFLLDFAYYGNTVSSPLVLAALGSDHTILPGTDRHHLPAPGNEGQESRGAFRRARNPRRKGCGLMLRGFVSGTS
jgi:hypothetical protein